MPFLTKFGQTYGTIPEFQGRIFWVAPSAEYTVTGRTYYASDSGENDGLSPYRALRTVNQAITNALANSGDVIRLLEGTHTVTATVAASRAGVTFVGTGNPFVAAARTILSIRGTDDELLNITASNVEFRNLVLRVQPNFSLVSFQSASVGIDGLQFKNCLFDLNVNAAATRNTRGIDMANRAGGQGTARMGTMEVGLGNGATMYLEGCRFLTNGAIGEALLMATGSVTMTDCRFHNDAGTWATPVGVATNVDNTWIDRTVWTTSGTMTLAMAGPQFNYALDIADSVHVSNCRFAANVGTIETVAGAKATIFDGFGSETAGSASLRLSQNYAFGGGFSWASGGVLVDRTT